MRKGIQAWFWFVYPGAGKYKIKCFIRSKPYWDPFEKEWFVWVYSQLGDRPGTHKIKCSELRKMDEMI